MRPRQAADERTCFQEGGDFQPVIDSKADVAIVYGLNPTFEKRVEHWRQNGYRIHVMTGVAWGDYVDYVRGQWDGVPHYDDAQAETGGFRIEHGISQGHDVYYMIPSVPYSHYLGEKLRRVVDAGALALHLEEPEFWSRGGYGPGFEREWREFYGEAWQDPVSSPDARYRASKLMKHLYTRALTYLFAEIKRYAREKGDPDFKCYVPTHSLVNYAHWRIVSPESALLAIPDCDGVIGQVWTGTSRTPNIYRGVERQRTFEAGYCEYAACAGMVRGTGRRLWQLADPIEDNPNYCWDDYRVNWECTVAGSLLVPESENFEIMPWPTRIFTRAYPTENLDTLPFEPLLEKYLALLHEKGQVELEAQTRRARDLFTTYHRERAAGYPVETIGFAGLPASSGEFRFGDLWSSVLGFYNHLSGWADQEDAQRVRNALSAFYHNAAVDRAYIPPAYATELQLVYNALADMAWPGETQWISGQGGVGLGLADSLMFQRGEPDASDEHLSSLYGLAMPLVKNVVALSMTQLERVSDPGYLDGLRILFLTYEGQKPPSAQAHQALVAWVQRGNVLVLCGQGDSYNRVREWWNQDGADFERPQDHLTELAGLGRAPADGFYPCGEGLLLIASASPCKLAYDPQGADKVFGMLQQAAGKLGLPCQPAHVLALRRGPYVAAAGMDESLDSAPYTLAGQWINLFDARLPVTVNPRIEADTRWLLYDLARCPAHPWVIAAAGRVENETFSAQSLAFSISGMAKTQCCVRARLPQPPSQATLDGAALAFEWDADSQTVLLQFPNLPAGQSVELRW